MRFRSLLVWVWVIAAPALVPVQASQPQPPSGEFVPVDEVPPGEQIPALPLLATAYGFIWVGLLGYVWSVGRRLQKVEMELAELESRKP